MRTSWDQLDPCGASRFLPTPTLLLLRRRFAGLAAGTLRDGQSDNRCPGEEKARPMFATCWIVRNETFLMLSVFYVSSLESLTCLPYRSKWYMWLPFLGNQLSYVCVHHFLFARWKVKILEDLERSRSEFSKSSRILTFHLGNKKLWAQTWDLLVQEWPIL